MPRTITRDEALELLQEWVSAAPLRRHCLAVEAAMRAYAERDPPLRGADGADVELWGVTGLLHDADYERHPDMSVGHPRMIMAELERRDAPPEMVRAIASHAEYLGVARETPMELTLHAVDDRRPRRQVSPQEAQATVVRGRGQPRRAAELSRRARRPLR
jgi:putative nucleotidyltransferase with HDIG domain